MSYATVLGVTPDREPVELETLGNSFGWAPSIWQRLLSARGIDGYMYEPNGPLADLMWSIDTLPMWEQVPLILTCDRGVVPSFAFAQAAEMLREFDVRLPAPEGHANHLQTVADLLDSQPEVPAIGVWVTSVTSNPFNPWDDTEDKPGTGISASEWYVLPSHRKQLAKLLTPTTP